MYHLKICPSRQVGDDVEADVPVFGVSLCHMVLYGKAVFDGAYVATLASFT